LKRYPTNNDAANKTNVRRLLNILACLTLVASLGTTATAHALERPDVSVAGYTSAGEQIVQGHAPGDSDEVPADGDKAFPHHHGGCHGDHVAAPVKVVFDTAVRDHRTIPVPLVETVRPRSTADPALRPPQA